MKEQQIISVKIATRIIQANRKGTTDMTVFPFERVYLTRNPAIARRMFRYYLSMPLDEVLLDGLNRVAISETKKKSVGRDGVSTAHTVTRDNGYEYPHPTPEQFLDIDVDDDWTLIVPTRTRKSINNGTLVTLLDYVMLRKESMGTYHNANLQLPQIMLHTPRGEKAILCARCKNVTRMYDGDCSPGTKDCAYAASVIVDAKKLQNQRDARLDREAQS